MSNTKKRTWDVARLIYLWEKRELKPMMEFIDKVQDCAMREALDNPAWCENLLEGSKEI